jgi:hypothetical protein
MNWLIGFLSLSGWPVGQQQPCDWGVAKSKECPGGSAKAALQWESPSLAPVLHEDPKMTVTSRQSLNVLTVIFLLLSTAGQCSFIHLFAMVCVCVCVKVYSLFPQSPVSLAGETGVWLSGNSMLHGKTLMLITVTNLHLWNGMSVTVMHIIKQPEV